MRGEGLRGHVQGPRAREQGSRVKGQGAKLKGHGSRVKGQEERDRGVQVQGSRFKSLWFVRLQLPALDPGAARDDRRARGEGGSTQLPGHAAAHAGTWDPIPWDVSLPLVTTPHTLHSTLYTLHPTPYTLHPTPYTRYDYHLLP